MSKRNLTLAPLRGTLISLTALACVGLGACEQDSSDGPTITVFQIEAAGECWRRCQGDAEPPLGESCTGDDPQPADPTDCEFTSGYDSIVVIAEYPLPLDKTGSALSSKVQILFDETELEDPAKPVGPYADLEDPTAVFNLRLPASSGEQMRLLVGTSQYQTPSADFASVAPTFELRFADCMDAECSFPAAAGTTTVTFNPPRVVGVTQGHLLQTVDGVALPAIAFDYNPNANIEFATNLAVPEAPFADWVVRAQIGEFTSIPLTTTIAPVEPLMLSVTDLSSCDGVDFAADLPRAVRGEWELECRRYNVVVSSSVRPKGLVTVTTDAGTLGAGGTQQQIALDDNGCGVVPLVLPESAIAPSVIALSAVADKFPTAAREWRFEPTPVVFGELFGPGGEIPVGADGTPAVAVSGNLVAPGQAMLGPNRKAKVVIDPGTNPDADLVCGAPLPDPNVYCDMELVAGQGAGGCQMSPNEVAVASDGSFSFPLGVMKCFVGTLTLDLWGVKIDEPEPNECMRDKLPLDATDESLIPASQTLTVTYVEITP